MAVRRYAWDRIGDHDHAKLRNTIRMFEAARLFNFTYVKLHPLDIPGIEILDEVFPFVDLDVVHNLELEKNDYNIAASNADAGHYLWAFWHDNRMKLPFWYNECSQRHSVDSAVFCFQGAGIFHPSRVLGPEARDLL